MKSISIDSIEVINGIFTMHSGDKNNTTKFNNLPLGMKDVLIDSSTQSDTKRFLFAKQETLSAQNLYGRTPDNQYFFKCASVSISTVDDKLTDLDFELDHQLNARQLQSHSYNSNERYKINIPGITLLGIDRNDVNDVLSISHLSLKDILIKAPVFEVSEKENQHHVQDHSNAAPGTIYQNIVRQMKTISIDTLYVVNGILITHTGAKNNLNKVSGISILLKNILIDSTARYETKRFLFAKQASLQLKISMEQRLITYTILKVLLSIFLRLKMRLPRLVLNCIHGLINNNLKAICTREKKCITWQFPK